MLIVSPFHFQDMLVICQDSDIECYADYSDTGSDTDVELSEAVSIFFNSR